MRVESPLEMYTSDKPLQIQLAMSSYWVCVDCIPLISPKTVGLYVVEQVTCDFDCSMCKRYFPSTISTTESP